MYYVTYGYNRTDCKTLDEAHAYIKSVLDRNELSYKKVYEHTENGVTVVVYQYWTLYMEVFVIHTEADLRR